MKSISVSLALAAAALVLPATVMAQTPASGGDLTRMLNGAPPATTPQTPQAPRPAPSLPPIGGSAAPLPQPAVTATPPATQASPALSVVPTTVSPAATPPAGAPVVTALSATQVAALPFTVELPAGFRITQGRQPPNSKVYAIQRGDQPFVRVYVGPESQFPIYSGEAITAGGRTSNVVTEGGQRRAVEHLFRREGRTPADIHVWTSSLEGADRALAERIAQSVDDR